MTFLSNLKTRLVGSVDDIVGDFHKVAARLDVRAKMHEDAAKAAAAVAAFEQAELDKARNVAAKIRALVS